MAVDGGRGGAQSSARSDDVGGLTVSNRRLACLPARLRSSPPGAESHAKLGAESVRAVHRRTCPRSQPAPRIRT